MLSKKIQAQEYFCFKLGFIKNGNPKKHGTKNCGRRVKHFVRSYIATRR